VARRPAARQDWKQTTRQRPVLGNGRKQQQRKDIFCAVITKTLCARQLVMYEFVGVDIQWSKLVRAATKQWLVKTEDTGFVCSSEP
jgi:hypothetical protein